MTTARNSRIRRYQLLTLITCLFVLPAYAKYSGGSGVPNDPYQIATAADLIVLGRQTHDYNKHFILTADIDLDPNLPGRKVFEKAVIASGTTSGSGRFVGTPFTGVFDGNGHAILNLVVKGGGNLGLFGRLESGAEVRDVGVVNVNMIGSGRAVGGLVGYNDGTIANCYSTGVVTGNSNVGGLVGENGSVFTMLTPGARGVTESYSDSTVDGDWCVGGLVGSNQGSIATSYSTGIVSATGGYVGGLVGWNCWYGDITYCYASCSISLGRNSNRIGGLVGQNEWKITQCFASGTIVSEGDSTKLGGLVGVNAQHNGLVISCFWDVEASGLSESDGGTGLTTAQMQDPNIFADAGWDFVHESDGPSDIWAQPADKVHPILWWQLPESQLPALPSFSGGTGDADDPYLISTPHELNSIGYNPRLMAAHFKLIEDIDLADVEFFIIGNRILRFSGIFDGNGHTISNFNYTSTNINHTGLFGYIDGLYAEVKNLGLSDPNVVSMIEGYSNSIGSLAGRLENGIISGCHVQNGSVSGSERNSTGGLAGISYGTIIDCSVVCSVSGTARVGGLVGSSYGIITDCKSSGDVRGNKYVGGLLGSAEGTITKCSSSGDVSGNDSTGGLIGVNSGDVRYCYSSSDVLSSGWEAGGLAGENSGTITDSYATGNTSGNNIAGGLVGSNGYINQRDVYWEDPGYISNCYSTGSVSGTSNVGGLLGRNLVGSITSCFWDRESSNQYEMCGSQNPETSGCDSTHGKTTAEMQTRGTFVQAGWDFVGEIENGTHEVWQMPEGDGYPVLATLTGYTPVQLQGRGTPEDPYLISNPLELGAIAHYPPSAHYRLVASIDLVGIRWSVAVIPSLQGSFDGNGLTISNLTITGVSFIGLFGGLGSGAEAKNLRVADVNITGSGSYVGALVGWNGGGVDNCYSSGTVRGSGSWYYAGVGGLAGSNYGSITASYSTGAVRGTKNVGGLVGLNSGTVIQCYSTGAVRGGENVGGLVGENGYGSIATSYSSGAVSGSDYVGGLVGFHYGSITTSYSSGSVSGTSWVGGLVGLNYGSSVISSFWDIQTSGQTRSFGGTGKTTAEMQTAKTFLDAGWDFVGETANGTQDLWWILEGKDYPRLWWEARGN